MAYSLHKSDQLEENKDIHRSQVSQEDESIRTYNLYLQPNQCDLKLGLYFYILGHVGWGIAWYINGLLIPEIHVVRGKTYTFVIEGGQDPSQAAAYHPFYITDDPEGGYEFMTEARKRKVLIFRKRQH